MEDLGTDQIDTIILSLSDKIFTGDKLPATTVMPLWSVIQKQIKKKFVHTAGLSNFNAKYLEQFIDALEDKSVRYNYFIIKFKDALILIINYLIIF